MEVMILVNYTSFLRVRGSFFFLPFFFFLPLSVSSLRITQKIKKSFLEFNRFSNWKHSLACLEPIPVNSPWQVVSRSITHRDKEPFTQHINTHQPNLHVFVLWADAGVPTDISLRHGENMPTGRFEPTIILLWGDGANHSASVPPSSYN